MHESDAVHIELPADGLGKHEVSYRYQERPTLATRGPLSAFLTQSGPHSPRCFCRALRSSNAISACQTTQLPPTNCYYLSTRAATGARASPKSAAPTGSRFKLTMMHKKPTIMITGLHAARRRGCSTASCTVKVRRPTMKSS